MKPSPQELINSPDFKDARLTGDEVVEVYHRRDTDETVGERDRAIPVSELFSKSLVSVENRNIIKTASDLPSPSGGIRQLDDGESYLFDGFVEVPEQIEVGNISPLESIHGGVGGIIHTGGNTAIVGVDSNFFAQNMSISAPGGTALDLTGTIQDEMLIESVRFDDVTGQGNFASLGTIDGMRVPTLKGSSLENFDGGLTFDGSPEKIHIQGCPFRGVTANGVTILDFLSSIDVDIVKIAPNNYIKGVQSDTEVVRMGVLPNQFFKYIGVDHDNTVTKSNVLNGAVSVRTVGCIVRDSFPIKDSSIIAEALLDSETTTTISSQNTWELVNGSISAGSELERISLPSNATLQYNGKSDATVKFQVTATVAGSSNETYEIAFFHNGTLQSTSIQSVEGGGQNKPKSVNLQSFEKMVTGDTVSLRARNIDGTGDIVFENYVFGANRT